jgi:hypothetical protein
MKRFRITSICTETFTAIVEAESDDSVRRFHDDDITWDYPETTCDRTSADWKVEEIQEDDPG